MGLQTAIFPRMTTLRDQQLAWLDHIAKSGNITLTEIARVSGLTPSTLTRFKNNDTDGHTLTARSVKKIEDATKVPAYEARIKPRIQAFSDGEATPYIVDKTTLNPLEQSLAETISRSNSIDLWRLKTGTIAAVGYPSGMVVMVDRDEQPRNGDAVCAQKYDFRRGTAETLFRVWRTPYLLTASSSEEPGIPEIVDNENVVIVGVVVGGAHIRH
jgi:transcriptional regulator with XRE-family HTH domain